MAGNAILPISFFKIILKTNLQRLKLPNMFTQRCGGALPNPVFLKTPDCSTEWEIYLTKENGEIWLEKGWKEFTEKYSLDEGHLVIFEYEGASKFDVLILDQSSLEIDYPSCDNNLDQGDDDSVQILAEWPDQKPEQKSLLLSPKPFKEDIGEKAAQRSSLSLNWPKGARAREVAESFISSKSNPFFTYTIKPHDVVKNRKYVPDLEGYIENIGKYVKLQIGERSWDVKLLGHYFSAGWSLFAMESELQPGDVCVFELTSREEDPTFEVHVFKHHN